MCVLLPAVSCDSHGQAPVSSPPHHCEWEGRGEGDDWRSAGDCRGESPGADEGDNAGGTHQPHPSHLCHHGGVGEWSSSSPLLKGYSSQ